MHAFAVVLIPFYERHASIRPLAARDAAALARLETLLFRYEQPPQDEAWTEIDYGVGYIFDWWEVGGRWRGWARNLRTVMKRQRLRLSPRPIRRCLERNAIWSEDLGRARLGASLFPAAIVTPHGEWEQPVVTLLGFGKLTARERKAKAAWLRRIRKLMKMYSDCLAIGVDYHF